MKTTLSFSDGLAVNGRKPWASCSIELELDDVLLNAPGLLHERIRQTYAMCETAVLEQLERNTPEPVDEGRHGSPVVDRMNQAPPPAARPALPAPATPPPNGHSARNYYANRRDAGRSNEGPPTTGKALYGWARDNDCVAWFTKFGKAQVPPLPHLVSDFPDDWAAYAYENYLAAVAAAPAAPSTNGRH